MTPEQQKLIAEARNKYFLEVMHHMSNDEKKYYLDDPKKSLTLKTFEMGAQWAIENAEKLGLVKLEDVKNAEKVLEAVEAWKDWSKFWKDQYDKSKDNK